MKKIFGNSFRETSSLNTTDYFAHIIGDLYKKDYKNIDTKENEKPVTDVERTQDAKGSEEGLTTNMVEQLRSELSRLRKFIGYDKVDTVDGKTGQYVFNPKAYENIFGYENQTTEEVDSETSEKHINVLTLLDYIYLIVQKDLSQDENDKDFETRVTDNKNKIDQILGWLEDSKNGEVTVQGIRSKVQTLWTTVTDVSNGLTKKVTDNTSEISKLKTLVEDGWSEGEGNDAVSYRGYKALIKDIYDQLSDRVTEAALSSELKNYYTKTDAENKFVAKVAGKDLSDKNFTAEFETLLETLRDEEWVRPVAGRQLSEENFTTALKTKLNGIEAKANKTEITSTITSDTDKVPSCEAVSTALAGKLNTSSKASGINDDNKNNDDIIPSVKAVTAYVDSKMPGAMDFTVTPKDNTISVTNSTDGLCAVRVTKMSDGSTQYQSSSVTFGSLSNKKTAFTFNIEASANYMIEAWTYNSGTQKLVPAAVKFI